MPSARGGSIIVQFTMSSSEPTPPPEPAEATSPPEPAEAQSSAPAEADAPGAGRAHASRGRMIAVNTLVGITSLLLIVAIFSVWANRLLFNPDNWSSTSSQLLQNDTIRATTANYIVDQIYANVDVAGLLKSGLPPRLEPLAAPAAGALRNVAVKGVDAALTRPRIQNLWAAANRAANQSFIAVVEGGKGAVAIRNGVVTLNLGKIVDDVASRLGLPSDLSSKLPPNVASLTVLKSNQLSLVQDAGNAIKDLALWLTILVPLLYALAIALATGRRRRTLMVVGFAAATAGVIALLGRSLIESQGTTAITNDASLQPTVRAVFRISTSMINEIGGAVIAVGLVLVVAAWFAGPTRIARGCREAIAPFLRDHAAAAYLIVVGIMVLIFIWNPIPATGKPAGIIVFLALALFGTFLLRRQTAEEFPEARAGTTTARMRARVDAMRTRRDVTKTPQSGPESGAGIPDQLRELSELHERGAISDDEYQAAKTQLLTR